MHRRIRRKFTAVVALLSVSLPVSSVVAHPIPDSQAERAADKFGSVRLNVARSAAESDPITNNFKVLGHVRFNGATPEGDVWVQRQGRRRFAYVGTWSQPCVGKGVRIVNVTRPARARQVAIARLKGRGESYEDPVVIKKGKRFILAVGVQDCSGSGKAGLALFNVTRPREPKKLAFLRTEGFGVHELDLAKRKDGRILALLAVNFAETFGGSGDVQIVDITRPRLPTFLSSWGIISNSSLPVPPVTEPPKDLGPMTSQFQGIGATPVAFAHSVRGADRGTTAYASYWDGGDLKLDISDPSEPVLVSRTTFPFEADGESHSMTPLNVGDTRYLLTNDEDFDHFSPAHVTSPALGAVHAASELQWIPSPLTLVGSITGEVFDAGDGCQQSDYEGASGKVVLVDSFDPFANINVPCDPTDQLVMAAGAGTAAVIANVVGNERPFGSLGFPLNPSNVESTLQALEGLPVVAVGSMDGLADELRAAAGDVPVTLEPQEPSWGFLRVFDESQASDADGDGVLEVPQVGSFAGPHTTGEAVSPQGIWSIHNTEVSGDRAYSSWYSNGIIALDVSDPTDPQMVGQFARPSRLRSGVFEQQGITQKTAQTWGVAVDRKSGLVYASDMRNGLWIIRPTGESRPSG
jgi:hypothetical protein